MRNLNRLILPLFLIGFCRTLVASPVPEIVVKGLSDNKAIIEYQGELIILREKQKKNGLLLYSVNNKRAVIHANGYEYTYFLDKSINQNYSKPAAKKQYKRVTDWLHKEPLYSGLKKSRLISARLESVMHNQVDLELEYYYSGDYGKHTQIVVSVISHGKLNKNIDKQFLSLEKGINKTKLSLKMNDSSEIVFHSDAINFSFMDREQKTSVFYSKTTKFEKYWNKVALR